jgi:hypothetical protein
MKPNLCLSCVNLEKEIVFQNQAWQEKIICLYNMDQRGVATACKNYEENDHGIHHQPTERA